MSHHVHLDGGSCHTPFQQEDGGQVETNINQFMRDKFPYSENGECIEQCSMLNPNNFLNPGRFGNLYIRGVYFTEHDFFINGGTNGK